MAPPPSTAVTPMPRPCACGESCTANRPCHCCLAAEVEALRAQNAALIGMVERDTAAIQRVRGELDWINDHPLGVDADEDNAVYSTVSRILRALDGGA